MCQTVAGFRVFLTAGHLRERHCLHFSAKAFLVKLHGLAAIPVENQVCGNFLHQIHSISSGLISRTDLTADCVTCDQAALLATERMLPSGSLIHATLILPP